MISVASIRRLVPNLPQPKGPKKRYVKEIRRDKPTQRMSIIDVIRVLTGKEARHASEALITVKNRFSAVAENILEK